MFSIICNGKKNKPYLYNLGKYVAGINKIKTAVLDLGDDLIVNEMKKNNWEIGSLKIWMGLLNTYKFQTVYDVGSYTGVYGLLALEKMGIHGNVKFYEANPFVFSRLTANLRLNGYSTAKAHWNAISDSQEDTIDINLRLDPTALTTAGSIIKNTDASEKRYQVNVPNLNANKFTSSFKGTILMKLDIEGAELPLLNELLNKYESATAVILVEILTETMFREVVRLVSSVGGSLYPINEENGRLGKLFEYKSCQNNRNFILATKKSEAIINALRKKMA